MGHIYFESRFLTGHDLDKQARAAALFEAVERGELTPEAPVTVIADGVYALIVAMIEL